MKAEIELESKLWLGKKTPVTWILEEHTLSHRLDIGKLRKQREEEHAPQQEDLLDDINHLGNELQKEVKLREQNQSKILDRIY